MTYLAGFLIFLGASAALALVQSRERVARRSAGSTCGGCAAQASGACARPEHDESERT